MILKCFIQKFLLVHYIFWNKWILDKHTNKRIRTLPNIFIQFSYLECIVQTCTTNYLDSSVCAFGIHLSLPSFLYSTKAITFIEEHQKISKPLFFFFVTCNPFKRIFLIYYWWVSTLGNKSFHLLTKNIQTQKLLLETQLFFGRHTTNRLSHVIKWLIVKYIKGDFLYVTTLWKLYSIDFLLSLTNIYTNAFQTQNIFSKSRVYTRMFSIVL